MTTRRELGALAMGALVTAACSSYGSCGEKRPPAGAVALPAGGSIPRRRLGRMNVETSVLGLGGFHIGIPKDDAEALRLIDAAIDHGVTFLDNCWDYNEGRSEERMGRALADGNKRQRVFLMTKIDGRTRASAAAQIDQSLKRLRTDHIDLVQIHEIIRQEDPARCFGPDGTMEALLAAQKAGKLRFLGFTGHKDPNIHLAMLRTADQHGFTFDAVQMPLNVMDAHYRSFEQKVLPVLLEKNIAVLGMKPLGGGGILESKVVQPRECLRYAMSLPTSVVITGCESLGVLEQAVDEAMRFTKMSEAEVKALLDRSRPAALAGKYEKFKTSEQYDGTVKNPKWLETAEI